MSEKDLCLVRNPKCGFQDIGFSLEGLQVLSSLHALSAVTWQGYIKLYLRSD